MATKPTDVMQVAAMFETISDDEMDRLLEGRHDEIQEKLAEARAAYDRGEYRELEPLYDFLKRMHEEFDAKRSDA